MKPTDVSYETNCLYHLVLEASKQIGGKVVVKREGWVQVQQDQPDKMYNWLYDFASQLHGVRVEAKVTDTQRLDRGGRAVCNLVVNVRLQEMQS